MDGKDVTEKDLMTRGDAVVDAPEKTTTSGRTAASRETSPPTEPTRRPVVYVLTNPSFPEYVKIGYADDLRARLAQLNRSECLPFAFRAYCVYEVDGRLKDREIHRLIDRLNPDLRSIETFDGRPRVREFYNMSAEDAYGILASIAGISGTTDRLHKIAPDGHELADEQTAEEIQASGAVPYTEAALLSRASPGTAALYGLLRSRIIALDGVSVHPRKLYVAFRTDADICDIQILAGRLKVYVNLPKGALDDPDGLAEDVSDRGHWGNGDHLVVLDDADMVDAVMSLVSQSHRAHTSHADMASPEAARPHPEWSPIPLP